MYIARCSNSSLKDISVDIHAVSETMCRKSGATKKFCYDDTEHATSILFLLTLSPPIVKQILLVKSFSKCIGNSIENMQTDARE